MNGTAGFRTRTTLYIGSSPAAVSADGESRYLSGDDIGSVRCVTDAYGRTTATLSYDVFGTPVADTGYESGADVMLDAVISRAAYAGKPYNPVTGLYDYGFRDYSPTLARFTTPDPIRDGTNWYAYCAGDPVNFVDKWGLKQVIANDIVQLTNNNIMSNSTGSLKKQTKILIQRSPDDNGNNGNYYQSTLSIMINDDINIFSAGVQSTADWPGYENDTLTEGEYEGILYPYSLSYEKPILIYGDDTFIHPDQITIESTKKDRIKNGQTNGPWNQPLSQNCQIMQLNNFNTMTSTLESIGFKYNWQDRISVTIKGANEDDKKAK